MAATLQQMKKYLVFDLRDPLDDYKFDTALEVAVFLWGRDLKNYSIFMRQDDVPTEIREMEFALERREIVSAL